MRRCEDELRQVSGPVAPSSCATSAGRQATSVGVVVGQPLDVVAQGVDAAGRNDAGLTHRAAHLLLAAPRLVDERAAHEHTVGWIDTLAVGRNRGRGILELANPAGLYVAGNTLSLGIAIWCFVAIVFRKFF